MKDTFIPEITVPLGLWGTSLRLPQLLNLDFEAPKPHFLKPNFPTTVFHEACILVRLWTFLLCASTQVWDKRKGRNITHIYTMPHESGFSFTILFVYLLTYLYICFTDKETELRKKFYCVTDLHVRKLCRVIQGETSSKCFPITLIILAFCFTRLSPKEAWRFLFSSSPRENSSFPRSELRKILIFFLHAEFWKTGQPRWDWKIPMIHGKY